MEDIGIVIAVIAIFAIQILISLTVKWRILRILPTLLLSILGVVFLILAITIEGWDAIGYILLMVFAWASAAAALLGMIIGAVIRTVIKRKGAAKPAECQASSFDTANTAQPQINSPEGIFAPDSQCDDIPASDES